MFKIILKSCLPPLLLALLGSLVCYGLMLFLPPPLDLHRLLPILLALLPFSGGFAAAWQAPQLAAKTAPRLALLLWGFSLLLLFWFVPQLLSWRLMLGGGALALLFCLAGGLLGRGFRLAKLAFEQEQAAEEE